eukprot:2781656-Prymnesium_polylepis.2
MLDPMVGSDAVVCFILSAATPEPALAELQAERTRHGDMLLVDAPETPWIIKQPTPYSNFTKRGRGMPTFKQLRFFQHAALTASHAQRREAHTARRARHHVARAPDAVGHAAPAWRGD